jgi:hypothetical protein
MVSTHSETCHLWQPRFTQYVTAWLPVQAQGADNLLVQQQGADSLITCAAAGLVRLSPYIQRLATSGNPGFNQYVTA